MSYGNFCLVSDIDECASVVEDKAIVFEMVDKYKKEAADFICEKYSWDDVVDKTMELYRGV